VINRKKTRTVKIGSKEIGGDNPVLIQSMTNTDTRDIASTIKQISELHEAGCDIIRVAVPDEKSAIAIKAIKKEISLPLVADIHFNQRLALLSLENGADKIRINPGNIGGLNKCLPIIELAKEKGAAIRIGVNSGSLDEKHIKKYNGRNAKAIAQSAFEYADFFNKNDFRNLVVSLKSSSVTETIEACRLFSEKSDIPLHLGVTEAGTRFSGTIKSSVGIGTLLAEGIGDTIRVSLTGNPVEEIYVAKEILKSLGLINRGIEIISCPTCGRCQIDLSKIAEEFERKTANIKDKNIKVAIMGCAVNGPGEAKDADIGIAGGKNEALLFKKGKTVKKIKEDDIIKILLSEIEEI
jgi:(E)-4-hydroxy-3-methylbut-2-enyl-diphosphate synthase